MTALRRMAVISAFLVGSPKADIVLRGGPDSAVLD